jgi:hypothetical protein
MSQGYGSRRLKLGIPIMTELSNAGPPFSGCLSRGSCRSGREEGRPMVGDPVSFLFVQGASAHAQSFLFQSWRRRDPDGALTAIKSAFDGGPLRGRSAPDLRI